MTLISHEIPKSLYHIDGLINDYPYILGHLMMVHGHYEKFYRKKIKESPFSIFDNGAFELGGQSIDLSKLYTLITEYRPSHFILPDKIHDQKETLKLASEWIEKYSTNSASIGAIQGENISELEQCFDWYVDHGITYIAIPFDPIPSSAYGVSRYFVFCHLLEKIVNQRIKIHFLGCENPSEFQLYSSKMKSLITSVDTSSPIITGWKGIRYGEYGYSQPKPKEKLADNLDIELSFDQIQDIIFNVKKFKQYWQ